jgi:hypothetical protein
LPALEKLDWRMLALAHRLGRDMIPGVCLKRVQAVVRRSFLLSWEILGGTLPQ